MNNLLIALYLVAGAVTAWFLEQKRMRLAASLLALLSGVLLFFSLILSDDIMPGVLDYFMDVETFGDLRSAATAGIFGDGIALSVMIVVNITLVAMVFFAGAVTFGRVVRRIIKCLNTYSVFMTKPRLVHQRFIPGAVEHRRFIRLCRMLN